MKKFLSKLKGYMPTLASVGLFWFGGTMYANAGIVSSAVGLAGSLALTQLGLDLNGIFTLISYILYAIFSLTSVFVGLMGTLFNVAMQLTVHLSLFITNTPIIYTIWTTIRDLSSMVLIFVILWAGIKMILNLDTPNMASMVKSIIIAGVLINFSFFIASVAIDASNVISLQFFNAVAPNNDIEYSPTDNLSTLINRTVQNGSGGVSGVFASALKINDVWKNQGQIGRSLSNANNALLQSIIAYFIGIVINIIVGVSFFAAAIATIWRTIVLIALLATSSIWIASMAVPGLSKASSEWKNHFTQNLLFLPIYLIGLYVVILFINATGIDKIVSQTNTSDFVTAQQYLPLFITFAVIIFLVNMPLVIAIQFSKLSNKMVGGIAKWTDSFKKSAPIWPAGWAARNSVGRLAARADEALGNTRLGNTVLAGQIRAKTTGALAKNNFGTSTNFVDLAKAKKEAGKKRAEIGRQVAAVDDLSRAVDIADVDYAQAVPIFKDTIGKMKEAEKLKLDEKYLTNIHVLKHFKKSDFEAIKKSEIKDEIKAKVEVQRIAALKDSLQKGENDEVKNMLKNMDNNQILDFLNKNYKNDVVPDMLIHNLTNSNLKAIGDEDLDLDIKYKIGRDIRDWATFHNNRAHPAYNFILKNKREWTGQP